MALPRPVNDRCPLYCNRQSPTVPPRRRALLNGRGRNRCHRDFGCSDLPAAKPAGVLVHSLECTFAGLRHGHLDRRSIARDHPRRARLNCSRLQRRASFLTRFKTRTHLKTCRVAPAACSRQVQARRYGPGHCTRGSGRWPITAHQVAQRRLPSPHVIARALQKFRQGTYGLSEIRRKNAVPND